MDDDTVVNNADTQPVEQAETPSTSVEEVSDATEESLSSSEDVNTQESADESDTPKSEKGQRRLQQIVNENKRLASRNTELEDLFKQKEEGRTDNSLLKENEDFIRRYDGGEWRNATADARMDALEQAQRSRDFVNNMRREADKRNSEFHQNYATAVEIERSTPLLNPDSDEYVEAMANEFQDKVFNFGVKALEAKAQVEKLYKAIEGRIRQNAEEQISDTQTIALPTTKSNTVTAKFDPTGKSPREIVKYFEDHPDELYK